MGQALTISDCIYLDRLAPDVFKSLIDEDYTVIRTDGTVETGWRIPSETHSCDGTSASDQLWACSHATLSTDKKTLKFHMLRDKDGEHVCGWRRNRTFWPTRLADQEAKEAWWHWLNAQVAPLKSQRQIWDEEEAKQKVEAEQASIDEIAKKEAEARRLANMTIGENFMALEKWSIHDANRARRLFDNGCPKAEVIYMCQIFNPDMRNSLLNDQEEKYMLEKLAKPAYY